MERFANELIEKIFSYLDEDSLTSSERVCVAWSRVVVSKVWFPRIRDQVRENDLLEAKLESSGWSSSYSFLNYELNHRLYRKLNSEWSAGKCDQQLKAKIDITPARSHCVKVKKSALPTQPHLLNVIWRIWDSNPNSHCFFPAKKGFHFY